MCVVAFRDYFMHIVYVPCCLISITGKVSPRPEEKEYCFNNLSKVHERFIKQHNTKKRKNTGVRITMGNGSNREDSHSAPS